MSWASRRRTTYLSGVILFFALFIGVPILYHFLTIPATCFDRLQNQGETAPDLGGPCQKLDPNALQPASTLWARSFKVRDGNYTAVAYVVNPNVAAGVAQAHYHFGLYDASNILIAEREGTIFLMPGGITPVLESGIDSGTRTIVHTYFQITDQQSLSWERMTSPAASINISNQQLSDVDTVPRVVARAINTSFSPLLGVRFVAVVFDAYGNAITASGTSLDQLTPNDPQSITFTWPQPFASAVGRIDIIPLVPPQEAPYSPSS